MTEAVIFDLDGSMVDSMWVWKAVDVEYLGRFGITPPDNLQSSIGGMSFSETAFYFKERFQIPDSVDVIKEEWNRMAWDKYTHEVPLKDGVLELLQYCEAHGIKAGIATSNSRELVEIVIKVHHLEKYFGSVLTGCEVARGKPAPDIYLEVAKRLAVAPHKCLVFEDITDGIRAGKAAGMRVCAVYDKYSAYQDTQKRALADYYTYNFKELIEHGILTDF